MIYDDGKHISKWAMNNTYAFVSELRFGVDHAAWIFVFVFVSVVDLSFVLLNKSKSCRLRMEHVSGYVQNLYYEY